MENCIMCGASVYTNIGYVTDGKISVCASCASKYSLMRVITRVSNSKAESAINFVWEAPIEVGLVNQTDNAESEADNADAGNTDASNAESGNAESEEILRDINTLSEEDFLSKYEGNYAAHALYYGAHREEAGEAGLVNQTDEDDQIKRDIEVLSEEDFLSKYCDDPSALGRWYDANEGAFLNV